MTDNPYASPDTDPIPDHRRLKSENLPEGVTNEFYFDADAIRKTMIRVIVIATGASLLYFIPFAVFLQNEYFYLYALGPVIGSIIGWIRGNRLIARFKTEPGMILTHQSVSFLMREMFWKNIDSIQAKKKHLVLKFKREWLFKPTAKIKYSLLVDATGDQLINSVEYFSGVKFK